MEKISAELTMAMDTPPDIRKESLDLNVGYDEELALWELILQYTGNLDNIREELDIEIDELLGGYAITEIPQNKIEKLSQYPQIIYIEKPKSLLLQEMEGIESSCIKRLRLPDYNLTGKNVLVACLDSGADIFHPDFRNPDGTTRIVSFWNQTVSGSPPEGYTIGREYSREEINEILLEDNRDGYQLFDTGGHGTAVLGVMAGNGNASEGNIVGVAPDADIIVVKLGNPDNQGFPRTTQLMLAIDYSLKMAMRLGKPLAINVSFGNNYGDHRGESVIERYMDAVSGLYRLNLVVGSGNEGLSGRHVGGVLQSRPFVYREEIIEMVVENYLTTFNLQIWKSYNDVFDIYLEIPAGDRVGPFSSYSRVQNYIVKQNRISVIYGEPTPYNSRQEIYISFTPIDYYITPGIWKIVIVPRQITDGRYNMWLPVEGSTTASVYFLIPSLDDTVLVPATAKGVITVSAYDSQRGTYAAFSGRGTGYYELMKKPDLCAPGVNINTCNVGGGYQVVTGTSFAAPFVTGACALLMEYGIINGRDPYLYGEKIRAVLIRGAIPLPYQEMVPDARSGYGRLCVYNSVRLL